VYGRGPLFVEALAERMGQDRFDKFLGDYARQFRWGIATADDFKRMAEAACACRLDDLFAVWLEAP
jgi:aminopeptidase N